MIKLNLLKWFFKFLFFKPIVKWFKIDSKTDRLKFPESAWKFVAYSALWAYCSYLLVFSGKYDYFTNSYDIWDGKYSNI